MPAIIQWPAVSEVPAKIHPMKTPALRFVVGIAVFAACAWLSKQLPAGQQPALKAFLIAASVLLIVAGGGKLHDFGFVRPGAMPWWKVIWPGLLLGATASLIALLAGWTGMARMVKDYSFLQIIVVIWFWSSLSEEIFCRGWFQSGLPEGSSRQIWSAALFGAMHLSLLVAGVDVPSALWIVTSAGTLGWICAVFRDRYQSLLPPFLTHAAFNVGGVLGGMLYVIGYRISTGKLPPQVTG